MSDTLKRLQEIVILGEPDQTQDWTAQVLGVGLGV